jgi:hypothetical protein
LEIQEFSFVIIHRRGAQHQNADGLSRRPCPEECAHCAKVELGRGRDSPGVQPAGVEGAVAFIPAGTFLDRLSREEILAAQLEDVDTASIISLIQTQRRPAEYEMIPYSRQLKILYSQLQFLHMSAEGLLVRRWTRRDGTHMQEQIVVPHSLQQRVLSLCHDAPTAGHFGLQRTYQALMRDFYWPRSWYDVRDYLLRCEVCIVRKGPSTSAHAVHPAVQYSSPMDCLYMDVCVISPASPAGYRFVISAVDSFSRFSWSRALKTQDSKAVIAFLVEDVFSSFGCCRVLKTDLDHLMVSRAMQKFAALFQVHHPFKIAYHPQSRGQVETYHFGLQTFLAKAVAATRDPHWERFIPLYLMAYRAMPHTSNGVSPYEAMFGRRMVAPTDLVASEETIRSERSFGAQLFRLKQQAVTIQARVLRELRLPFVVDSPRDAVGFRFPVFQPGDLIWYKTPIKIRDARKLDCPWVPAVVDERLAGSPVTYIIRLPGGRTRYAHIKNLGKRFVQARCPLLCSGSAGVLSLDGDTMTDG